MDIRKCMITVLVGMAVLGCSQNRSRSEDFLARMDKSERKAAWERKWASVLPKELLPYWEVLDTIGNELRNEGYACFHDYCMHDITGDSIPELWITRGFCENNKKLYTYKLVDDRPVKIFEDECGHGCLFKGKDKVIRESYQGSFGYLEAYEYDGNKIQISESISYDELNDEEIQHASDENEEKRFQALRAECVEELEFREVKVK